MVQKRGVMALIGALAGGALYLLGLVIEAEWLAGRPALALVVLAGVFFGGLLATAGRLALRRAVLGAAAVAVVLGALCLWASLRFAAPADLAGSMMAVISVVLLAWLPWPFLMAQGSLGWRDYPSLFQESWDLVVRVSVALIFTTLVWLVIFLSKALLDLVGVPVLDLILDQPAAPWIITGTILGLAMAVVSELADVLSPGLVLGLLRLLVPVVLAVMAIFLAALPLRGFDYIFGGVSSAMVLLAMTAAAITLVTSALDESDPTAVRSVFMVQSARALAAITVLPAGLAAWSLWQRVAEHGWTPPRLLGATAAALGLAYGLAYLAAVLRGKGWMDRIRQANLWLALALMGLAALWLSLLDPEAISARSQLARIADGRTPMAQIDLYAFQGWGLAGAAALERLHQMAASDPALAARLALTDQEAAPTPPVADLPTVLRALTASLPLQPDTPEARALRDRVLSRVALYDLQRWQTDCDARLPKGEPGCVLVVADFMPALPGPEAMILARDPEGYLISEGFSFPAGAFARHSVTSYDGSLPTFDAAAALISALQQGAPPLSALPLNQITVAGQPGLIFAP